MRQNNSLQRRKQRLSAVGGLTAFCKDSNVNYKNTAYGLNRGSGFGLFEPEQG